MLNYYRPDNLNDGLVALSDNSWTLLAGGTDFYPARVGKHLNEKVMDLTGIRELRSIRETEDQIYIGALTTWTDIVNANLNFYEFFNFGGIKFKKNNGLCL